MDDLHGNALLALLGLARAPGATAHGLAMSSVIEQFDDENAAEGLRELEQRGLAAYGSGGWELTAAGQAEARARHEPHGYL